MELDDQARRILSLARDERTPDAEDKARIDRRVALALGVTLAASGTASVASSTVAAAQSAAAQSTGGTAAIKAAGTTGVLKGLIGGGALLVVAAASYAALSSGAPLSKTAPTAKAPQAVTIGPTPAPAPAPTPALAPAAPVAAADTVAIPEPAPTQPAEHSAHARKPRAHEARLLAQTTSLADVELLHQAQAAWRERDASRALGLLVEHRKLYPRSQMQLERDALRVLTLCELGRQADAAQLAQRLLARAPRSPLRSSIEESCALK